MLLNKEQVEKIVNETNERTRQQLSEQINRLTLAIDQLKPLSVEQYDPVSINPLVPENTSSLDLIKSLPEFSGDSVSYPAWRSAAEFAINYYPEGSEKYYIAMGIFRNKIIGSANATLASFNTVLNFKAILTRLDQEYADKRPLYVLENELSILRQDNLSIAEYYNRVDKKLCLIINKQIMSYGGNREIIAILNERARENALRVFISGLRRPMCDILFSARPKDLPTALAAAQELCINHRRYDFAEAFAIGNTFKPNKPLKSQYRQMEPDNRPHTFMRFNQNVSNKPTPMEVDTNTGHYRHGINNANLITPQHQYIEKAVTPHANYISKRPHLNPNVQVTYKRNREQSHSDRSPFQKLQKVNYMPEEVETSSNGDELLSQNTDFEYDYYNEMSQNNNHTLDDNIVAKYGDEINCLNLGSLLPFITKRCKNGQDLRILIDTGTSKNYVKDFSFLQGVKPLEKPFNLKSINGTNLINRKCLINLLDNTSTFFLLSSLSTFDGIIGYDFLRQIDAKIDTVRGYLLYRNGKEKLQFLSCDQVNAITIDEDSVPAEFQAQFQQIMDKNINAFADPNRALPYNTTVKGKIRTNTSEPIYSRNYPYPISVAPFVNNEIKSLLKDGIIRESCSPYNSPVHVVSKKGFDEDGKPKMRMVIDYRKINEKTIPDRYPIPDTSVILANLGRSKFFTTLDLKSGFHQIILCEKDRQKTAFSINNGKYEFCRLPFGLRNAPSIFQRAIDDVLREVIGKYCHVYVDDIIIYSPDGESHLKHIDSILRKLENAGMRISPEKSKFFKSQVEFLGFIVSETGIKTCPDKVRDIVNYEPPKTLRALRSFLGLSGYYRRFVKDYAAIVKPLTIYLRGENGQVGKRNSKNVKINFDSNALQAFEKIKRILASEDVLLQYPDYSQPFELTTDASSTALGAVLSQKGRPITMISRTLSASEQNYATNERELLAIVWALKKLRHYLYGMTNIQIFTDHQPLIFAISEKNPNAKMKRWRAFIEEFAPSFHFKPGKDNKVADALSRQFSHILSEEESGETLHSEESFSNVIRTVKCPINQFRNQLMISKSNSFEKYTETPFGKLKRHTITFDSLEGLIQCLRDIINPDVTNGIYCDLPTLAEIQNAIILAFPGVKFIHTELLLIDLINRDDQMELITTEHNRAHRGLLENFRQISREYYFPDIKKLLKSTITNCKICLENKYQRKPPEPGIGKTPIPQLPGEILHMDIFITGKQLFLTCVDKFSKFAIVKPITSRSTVDIKYALLEVLLAFNNTKVIVSDNEKAFQSNAIKVLLRDRFSIDQFFIPTLHSESNGQVERLHSTLLEIARCVKEQQDIDDIIELVILATHKYNCSYHSVINARPTDVFHNCATEKLDIIRKKLTETQEKTLQRNNQGKTVKIYSPGEKVFIRRNKRLGNKFDKVFIEKIIEKDLGTTVLINGKKVHKSNLR